MDRLTSPGDDCNEAPEPNLVDTTRSTIVSSTGATTFQWDQAHAPTPPPRLAGGAENEEKQPAAAEPWAVIERLDIDTAMVEALRSALASGHGSSGPGWDGPGWDGPEPYQRGEARRQTDLGVLTQGPPELARRCDIDLAVLDALRHAKGPDTEVPGA